MCVNCLETMCSSCATRGAFLVVAPAPTGPNFQLRACRHHVDEARESVARAAGVRPTITEIPASPIETGGVHDDAATL